MFFTLSAAQATPTQRSCKSRVTLTYAFFLVTHPMHSARTCLNIIAAPHRSKIGFRVFRGRRLRFFRSPRELDFAVTDRFVSDQHPWNDYSRIHLRIDQHSMAVVVQRLHPWIIFSHHTFTDSKFLCNALSVISALHIIGARVPRSDSECFGITLRNRHIVISFV